MINDVKGYCQIKRDNHAFIFGLPDNEIESSKIKKMISDSAYLPIMDIAVNNSGFLCYGPSGTLIDITDMKDVTAYFLCDIYADVICPKGLSTLDRMVYASKRLLRKGGYGDIIRKMVIVASLHKGKVEDNFLFSDGNPGSAVNI